MAPGSAALADHPKTVNLREDVVTAPINEWLCRIFDPDNRDETPSVSRCRARGARARHEE